jgi:hypothetical protein
VVTDLQEADVHGVLARLPQLAIAAARRCPYNA